MYDIVARHKVGFDNVVKCQNLMKPSLPLILLFVLKSDNLEQFIKELFPFFRSCARCLPALCMSCLSLATQYIDLARPVLQKRLKNDQTSQRTFRIFLVINIYLKGLAVGTPMVIFFKTMQEDDRWAVVYDDDDDGDDNDDGVISWIIWVLKWVWLLFNYSYWTQRKGDLCTKFL